MPAALLSLDEITAFDEVRGISLANVTDALRAAVKQLHEADDIENFLRTILADREATPHGPAEMTDIFTHRIAIGDTRGMAAFILKGRSYSTVRPKDVAHQIYRLEKLDGLHYAAFGSTGVVLDAAKEQFVSTCCRLGIAYSIIDTDDFARLFWAYGFLCPRDGSRIIGGRCKCGYAPSHSVLNVLQREALIELVRARELGHTKALVVLPPSSGKTRIAAKDAKAAKASRVLYIAHTHEILDVAHSEFEGSFEAGSVTTLENFDQTNRQQVCLTTIQYLSRNLNKIRGLPIDYVVVDEFHHAAARSYRQVLSSLQFDFLLGLTATPFRQDRQDILALCDRNVVVNFELRSGVEFGILSPYHYYGCFDDIDYSTLPLVNGRYSVRDLERRLIIRERHQAIVSKWLEKADGKPTLAFCCSHKHAAKVAEEFSSQGIPAEVYLSHTPLREREGLISRLSTGEVRILCVVDVLNEGADIPFVECLLFVRPTESKRVFLQQLGRGLRKYVGKTHCVVIDFIGNFRNASKIVDYHGLHPDEDSPLGPLLSLKRNTREVLDLPLGCKVEFDDKVLDIFSREFTDDPRNIRRDNISRILLYRYDMLCKRLDRTATKKDVDMYELLHSRFYEQVFGSWRKFQALIEGKS